MDKLVSVIIPKRKGEDITRFVEAIEKSTPGEFKVQVIIVNLGKERSYQRNEGIDYSKADYCMILDSDQMVSPDLISECVELMKYGYSSVYIPEVIPGDGFFNKVRNFERSFYTATCVDVVRFVRKDKCPKFDLTLSGPEDSSWDREVPGIRATSRNVLYHYDNINLWGYVKKKAYYGKSMRKYKEKHPFDKILDIKYRAFGIFVEQGKWKRLIKNPILTLGLIGLLAIRGAIWSRS